MAGLMERKPSKGFWAEKGEGKGEEAKKVPCRL